MKLLAFLSSSGHLEEEPVGAALITAYLMQRPHHSLTVTAAGRNASGSMTMGKLTATATMAVAVASVTAAECQVRG
jgi:hypothetical protein